MKSHRRPNGMRSENLCRKMALMASMIVINPPTRSTGRTVTPNRSSFHVRVMLSYLFLNTCNIAEQYTAAFLASLRQMAVTGDCTQNHQSEWRNIDLLP